MSDINEKVKAFYGGLVDLTPDKITLTGTGNKCPVCGKVFEPTPPLLPNVTMREFYGGRVKFFKDVDCDCTGKYKLLIEQRFDYREEQNSLKIIDMIVLKEGLPAEEKKLEEDVREELSMTKEELEETKPMMSLQERTAIKNEIKIRNVLATIVDADVKVETLCYHTLAELQTMCKRRKLPFTKKMNKVELARMLIAYDPSLVSPNPEG